jgi:hypothetical protein
MKLLDFGSDALFAEPFEPCERDNLIPAPVVAQHGLCELLCRLSRLGGIPSGTWATPPSCAPAIALRPRPRPESGSAVGAT